MAAPSSVGISGVGKYIPKKLVSNSHLAKQCGVSEEWIQERTGIQSRFYADPNETASFMGAEAARQALKNSKLSPSDIGLILCCTYTGDYQLPPSACKIQQILSATNAGALDLSSGSAGFVAALTIASDRIKLDASMKHVLVIAVAAQSPFVKKDDPKTAVIFGDGAAAAVVSSCASGYGVLETVLFSNGEAFEALRLRRGDSRTDYLEMDGLAVGKQYLKYQPIVIKRLLEKSKLSTSQIDLFIFHQANFKIIELLMAQLELKMEKTFTNVQIYGNTSDASVALALCEAAEKKILKRGNRIVLAGVGAGMTFNACVLRWV